MTGDGDTTLPSNTDWKSTYLYSRFTTIVIRPQRRRHR